jgi:hypothetical protein
MNWALGLGCQWLSDFFKVNFVCCHTGDHPQGDLATFGYIPVMTVKKNPGYLL